MYYHNQNQDRYIGTREGYSIFFYDYQLKTNHTYDNGIEVKLLPEGARV
jgi:hypothetical protein